MRLDDVLAPSPAKRAVERTWLLYTPVWGLACAVVMVAGIAERWGDAELMTFGATLGLGAIALPIARRPPEDRAVPLYRSTAARMSVSVALFAFLQNYFQTPFFFDVLHMHYGFASTWNIENNPVFLYFLTIAYFSTYAALLTIGARAARTALASRPRLARLAAYGVVPFAIAALETLLNANPFMRSLFCYDDPALAIGFGSLAYGAAFVLALPIWLWIDESPRVRLGMAEVVLLCLLAVAVHTALLHVLRVVVAPHLTTVVDGANGLRDFDTSCLARPEP